MRHTHTASIAIPWICDSSTHAAEDSGGTGKAGWLGAASAAADCDIQSSSVTTELRLSASGKPVGIPSASAEHRKHNPPLSSALAALPGAGSRLPADRRESKQRSRQTGSAVAAGNSASAGEYGKLSTVLDLR